MKDSKALLELDSPPKAPVRDACDVLTRLSREDLDEGDRLGREIDVNDDDDAGLAPNTAHAFASLLAGDSGAGRARTAALEMRESLLDHGAHRVRSPFTGRAGGVSIELIPGRGPTGSVWYTNTYRARLHHHTASARITSARLTPALGIVKNGRSDLQGPLANGYGGGDFVYRIITFGWANHPGLGGPRNYGTGTIPKDNGRPYLWGTEWDWDGISQWPDEYLEWMSRCDAGLADFWKLPIMAQDEHKGWAMPPGRKSDRVAISRAQSIAGTSRFWDLDAEEDELTVADIDEINKRLDKLQAGIDLIWRGDNEKPGQPDTHPQSQVGSYGHLLAIEEQVEALQRRQEEHSTLLKEIRALLTPVPPSE